MTALLEVRGLEAGYGRFRVLHDVSLAIPEGGAVAVLGPNGAGKSTLLRTVAGLLRPTAGTIRFAGTDVVGLPPSELARRGLCLVPEGRGIFPTLTVRENLEVARGDPGVAYEVFPILRERLGQVARTLSGGEQQMLAVARALVTSPRLLLLDELSLGLAPQVVDAIYAAVAGIHAEGGTVVLVEQYVERALELCDLVVVLEGGRVRFAGEPNELGGAREIETYLGAAAPTDR